MITHHLKVGLAAILAMLLLVGGAWYVSGSKRKSRETYPVTVMFDNVQGLEAEAPVRLAGVNVGWVESVSLRPSGRAALKLAIFRNVRIPKGSDFTIQVGFLQDKLLDIKTPPPDQRRPGFIKPGARIAKTASPVTMDDLMAASKQTISRVDKMLAAFDTVLSNGQFKAQLLNITSNVEDTTEQAAELARILKETGVDNRQNIDVILDNMRVLTARLNTTADKLNSLLDNANEYAGDKKMQADIKDAVTRFRNTAENIEVTSESLKSLATDPEVIDDLKSTIKETRQTMSNADVALSGVSRFVKSWNNTEVKPTLTFRYVSHESKFHMNMGLNLFPPSKEVTYMLGLNDVGEDNNTDVMVGIPGAGGYWLRFGLKEGKLGLGFNRLDNHYLYEGELVDPNHLRLNLRVGHEVSDKLYIMLGVESILKKNWMSLGVTKWY